MNARNTIFSKVHQAKSYLKSGNLAKAFACLEEANAMKNASGLELVQLVNAWEKLLGLRPLEPRYHLGMGLALEKDGFCLEQAPLHYQQSLALSAGHRTKELDMALSRVPGFKNMIAREHAGLNVSQKAGLKRKADFLGVIASRWVPTTHQGPQLTRCETFFDEKGLDKVNVLVSSGSPGEDSSVVSAITTAPFSDLGSPGDSANGLYDFVFVSNGPAKFVDYWSLGSAVRRKN